MTSKSRCVLLNLLCLQTKIKDDRGCGGEKGHEQVFSSNIIHVLYLFDLYSQYCSDEIREVPEPSTIILIGSGLLGLAGFKVRRKKARGVQARKTGLIKWKHPVTTA
ncbi:MAG TPA: PEP-CTERM sorting domain-containing protein, partial [Deltaproteobacteria bacterium]|nr:PEP-CTERM sorting domain-containing protein [Deltaproteobacteria bacterium]